MAMRGLTVFIGDIRACRSREEEEKRVNKELANIRHKFKEGKMTSYDKKKYVLKLLYMHTLGWDVDFGHVEAVKLITGTKFSEKQVGYLAVTLLLTENSDLARMIVNSVRQDLVSFNDLYNCLALCAIANVGSREMAEALYADVYKLLISENSKGHVKKKASLCLLRLYHKNPEVMPVADWAERILNILRNTENGVATSILSLIMAFAQQYPQEYAGAVERVIQLLGKVSSGDVRADYEYHKVPNPWLQVKCMRLLQQYPAPTGQLRAAIDRTLSSIIAKGAAITAGKAASSPGINSLNALTATLVEAMNVAIYYDPDSGLASSAIPQLLGAMISHKEANIRYMGLEVMATLATAAESIAPIQKYTDTVLQALRDRDISIRRRALDLLYCMCDENNAKVIVAELLTYLGTADFAIREELVLKIAILAERYATEYSWYVDVILQLISDAGDHVSEEVWYRVVQIVANNPDLQPYAVRTVLKTLQSPTWHETALKIGAYLLGEYGDFIHNEPGCSPIEQFRALHSKFAVSSLQTKSLLLSAYIKLLNLFPELRRDVENVFRQYADVLDVELQQRACEYISIGKNTQLLEIVCAEMPTWPQSDVSALVSLVEKRKEGDDAQRRSLATREKRRHAAPSAAAASAPSPSMPSAPSAAAAAAVLSTATPAAAPAKAADLLGLLDGGSAAPSAAAAGGLSADFVGAPSSSAERSFALLLQRASGVLYEDDWLQLGVKLETAAGKVRLTLFYGNRSGAPLSLATSLDASASTGLAVQSRDPPTSLPVAAQAQQVILASAEAAEGGWLAAEPLLRVAFAAAGATARRVVVRLPIAVCKFMAGVSLGSDDFFARWKQLGGPPKEAMSEFSLPVAVDGNVTRAMLTGMGALALDGIDPNPANAVAAGIVTLNSGAKVGVLARVQTAGTLVRVTVRSTSPAISEAMVRLIKAALMAQ